MSSRLKSLRKRLVPSHLGRLAPLVQGYEQRVAELATTWSRLSQIECNLACTSSVGSGESARTQQCRSLTPWLLAHARHFVLRRPRRVGLVRHIADRRGPLDLGRHLEASGRQNKCAHWPGAHICRSPTRTGSADDSLSQEFLSYRVAVAPLRGLAGSSSVQQANFAKQHIPQTRQPLEARAMQEPSDAGEHLATILVTWRRGAKQGQFD